MARSPHSTSASNWAFHAESADRDSRSPSTAPIAAPVAPVAAYNRHEAVAFTVDMRGEGTAGVGPAGGGADPADSLEQVRTADDGEGNAERDERGERVERGERDERGREREGSHPSFATTRASCLVRLRTLMCLSGSPPHSPAPLRRLDVRDAPMGSYNHPNGQPQQPSYLRFSVSPITGIPEGHSASDRRGERVRVHSDVFAPSSIRPGCPCCRKGSASDNSLASHHSTTCCPIARQPPEPHNPVNPPLPLLPSPILLSPPLFPSFPPPPPPQPLHTALLAPLESPELRAILHKSASTLRFESIRPPPQGLRPSAAARGPDQTTPSPRSSTCCARGGGSVGSGRRSLSRADSGGSAGSFGSVGGGGGSGSNSLNVTPESSFHRGDMYSGSMFEAISEVPPSSEAAGEGEGGEGGPDSVYLSDWVINPQASLYQQFQAALLLLAILIGIIEPFNVAFLDTENVFTPVNVFIYCTDAVFLSDVLLSFFVPEFRMGEWKTSLASIAV
ncbi:unnamed protein product, partial [Closterium sp. Naga37s-1]